MLDLILLENYLHSKNMFGYQFSGLSTEEWYHVGIQSDQLNDYSSHMQNAFKKWLKNKYQENGKLQAAWNNPEITFEKAQIPSREERMGDRTITFRDPETQMNVIDFYIFYS